MIIVRHAQKGCFQACLGRRLAVRVFGGNRFKSRGGSTGYPGSVPGQMELRLPLVAYAFFAGLVSSPEELLDAVGADDDSIPEEDLGADPAPLQLAAIQVGQLAA